MAHPFLRQTLVAAGLLVCGGGCDLASDGSGDPPRAAVKMAVAKPDSADPNGEPAKPNPQDAIVPAKVGVGAKGRSLDEHDGLMVTPAKSLFAAKERIAFEIAVPHALNLYKAEHGQAPRTHEEFMQKIIVANQIQLPELPPGRRYMFDPVTEQLMVGPAN